MEFRLISDTHLEHGQGFRFSGLPGDDQRTLIIAGDFASLRNPEDYSWAMDSLLRHFKHVVYVPGNHEYYGTRIDRKKNIDQAKMLNPNNKENFHFLNRGTVTIDGVKIIGQTLWTNMNNRCPVVGFHLQTHMNDFRAITYFNGRNYGRLKPADWLKEHDNDLSHLVKELEGSDEPIIVVSHHAPSHLSGDPRYAHDTLTNYGYTSDLSQLILDNPSIKFWCHGHIHCKHDYVIGDTRILCNPNGYPGEETKFNPSEVYTVEATHGYQQ